MKKEREKSDPSIGAKRPANKPETPELDLWGGWAEPVEGRDRGKHGRATHVPDTEPGKRVPGA
jgi:hypothetical protein